VQGVPTGEAFVQLDSEYAAELASTTKTKKLYIINGAKRYMEVIQCCGDDMNVALNCGLSPPSPVGVVAAASSGSSPGAVPQSLSVVPCIPSSSLVLPAQPHHIIPPSVVQPRPYLSQGPCKRTYSAREMN